MKYFKCGYVWGNGLPGDKDYTEIVTIIAAVSEVEAMRKQNLVALKVGATCVWFGVEVCRLEAQGLL